jgi:uncharacterized membrane protein YdjX (TVP38/TMEM64 family)
MMRAPHRDSGRAGDSNAAALSRGRRKLPLVLSKLPLLQLGMLLTVAAVTGLAYLLFDGFREELDRALAILGAGDAPALRDYILSFGHWGPIASLLLMVLQALAAPIPSFVITFANGLAYGVFWGSLLSVAGHSLAAGVCFWIARTLGRRPVETLVGRSGLAEADRWFTRRGAVAVFLARLIPGVGFDAVSYAAGLSGITFGRFMLATTIGMVPQAFLYSYLGQNASQYFWHLVAANASLTGGLVLVGLVRHRRGRRSVSDELAQVIVPESDFRRRAVPARQQAIVGPEQPA